MTHTYKRDDFANQNEVRWCPGCGDYAILAAIQRILPDIGLPPERHVFVSGIGCSGRLPYYMNCYGFHTIHGRALPVATGLKTMRDDLCVWVITGDGDALSIGTNHLVHALRRNVNVNILLLNNQIYGLTKGQYSPTSQQGQVTKTSPQGLAQEPLNPIALALASGASFVARAVDKDPKHLGEVLLQAQAHQGASFVEIYQDCHIFNEGAFDAFSAKTNRAHHTIALKKGQPLCFGEHNEHVLQRTLEGFHIEPSAQCDTPYTHHPEDAEAAMLLARLRMPDYPVPLGVYYQHTRPVFTLPTTKTRDESDLEQLFKARGVFGVGGSIG